MRSYLWQIIYVPYIHSLWKKIHHNDNKGQNINVLLLLPSELVELQGLRRRWSGNRIQKETFHWTKLGHLLWVATTTLAFFAHLEVSNHVIGWEMKAHALIFSLRLLIKKLLEELIVIPSILIANLSKAMIKSSIVPIWHILVNIPKNEYQCQIYHKWPSQTGSN